LICLWVFGKIFAIFSNPSKLDVLTALIPTSPEAMSIYVDGKTVLMPATLFKLLGYGIVASLLLGAGVIGGIFLRGGIKFFPSSFERKQ